MMCERNAGYTGIRVVRALSSIIKNMLIAISLLIAISVLARFWSLQSLLNEKRSSCVNIEFVNLATATRCKDFTQIINNKNGLSSSIPSSVAQAVVVSARELYYNNNLVFYNILNEYEVKINNSSILFQDIDLRLDILEYERQLTEFGGLLDNTHHGDG